MTAPDPDEQAMHDAINESGPPDYSRWEDDTNQSYALRIASQVIWQVGSLLVSIGDELLDAAYPNTSLDMSVGDDK